MPLDAKFAVQVVINAAGRPVMHAAKAMVPLDAKFAGGGVVRLGSLRHEGLPDVRMPGQQAVLPTGITIGPRPLSLSSREP